MDRIEVTLQDIFWALKKYIIWIILACIVGAVGAYAYTKLFVTPIYSARVSMVAFASERNGTDVSSGELAADSSITNTHTALMNSQPVCEAVSEAMNGRVSPAMVSGMIMATRVSATQVINVELVSTNPQLAVEVGNTLLEVAPKVLKERAGGEISPVNRATYAGRISPNVMSNVVYGLMVALIVSCAAVVLVAVLDTTIWREEDLERAYEYPVLGSVPSMTAFASQTNKKKKKGR